MPTPSRADRLALAILLAAGALAYANAFGGVFQFDDEAAVLNDPHLQRLDVLLAHIGHVIRPVSKLTFLADRWCYGSQPAGYHLLNLLLHLANGLLVYQLLMRLIPAPAAIGSPRGTPSHQPDTRRVAFCASLLFLVHPVGTEVVTYISGRPTALMTFFYLAALAFVLRAARPDPAPRTGASRGPEVAHHRNSRWQQAGAVVCLAFALLSKEVAIVFPLTLLLWEFVIRRSPRQHAHPSWWRAHLPAWTVVLTFLAVAAFHARYAFLLRYAVGLRGWHENLLTQANAVAYALTLLVLPLPSRLNFDHDLPAITAAGQWPTPLSLALIVGLIGTAIAFARRTPLYSFGILWFFVHLLPTNSILPRYDVLSERNLYLPSIGLFLAIVAAASAIARWMGARLDAFPPLAESPRFPAMRQRAAFGVVALLALLLATVTLGRNALYADAVAFWSDAAAKSPLKARPHTNLGLACYRAGQTDRAIDEFRTALALDPNDPVAQRNLLLAWTTKPPR